MPSIFGAHSVIVCRTCRVHTATHICDHGTFQIRSLSALPVCIPSTGWKWSPLNQPCCCVRGVLWLWAHFWPLSAYFATKCLTTKKISLSTNSIIPYIAFTTYFSSIFDWIAHSGVHTIQWSNHSKLFISLIRYSYVVIQIPWEWAVWSLCRESTDP